MFRSGQGIEWFVCCGPTVLQKFPSIPYVSFSDRLLVQRISVKICSWSTVVCVVTVKRGRICESLFCSFQKGNSKSCRETDCCWTENLRKRNSLVVCLFCNIQECLENGYPRNVYEVLKGQVRLDRFSSSRQICQIRTNRFNLRTLKQSGNTDNSQWPSVP